MRIQVFAPAAAAILLAGCGSRLSGTYSGHNTGFFDSLTFKSGGKVDVTFAKMTKEGAYEIDGNRVKIIVGNDNQILTLNGACLEGGGFLGKYCKGAESREDEFSGVYATGTSTEGLRIDFRGGGKMRFSMVERGVARESREGTYQVSGPHVTIHVKGGESVTLTRSGNTLEGNFGGTTVKFRGQ